MSARHPQVRQREQRHQLRRVLRQTTEAHLHITELALDHPERMLDLGSYLSLGLLNLALGFVQSTALIKLLVSTTAGGDLPDGLPAFMFRAFLDAGVTRVGTDHVLIAVQQLIDLGDIGHVGRRAHHAVHQARLIIDTDVRLHAEVVLVTLLGLMHFRVALTVLVLGRTRRIDQRGIDDRALAQRQPSVAQIAIEDSQDAGG